MKRVLFLISLLLLSSCGGQAPSPEVTAEVTSEVASCFDFTVTNPDALTCTVSGESRAVLQTQAESEVTLNRGDALSITLRGTSAIERRDNELTITTLSGQSVINMGGISQVLEAGSQLALPLIDGLLQGEGRSAEASNPNQNTAANQLNNPENNSSRSNPDSAATAIPLAEIDDDTDEAVVDDLADGCNSTLGWRNVYVVKQSDVLEIIARRFGTTVALMTQANCLLNPGRLEIGQILRVPRSQPLTPTPFIYEFRSDYAIILRGECTILRWEVGNVETVYLQGQVVREHDILRVCPRETTLYTLRIVFGDGTERNLTVNVQVRNP